jgi:hypothetical protein
MTDARHREALRQVAHALSSRPGVTAEEVVAIRDALELAEELDRLDRAAAVRADAQRRLAELREIVRRSPLPPHLVATLDRARSFSHGGARMFGIDTATLEIAGHMLALGALRAAAELGLSEEDQLAACAVVLSLSVRTAEGDP